MSWQENVAVTLLVLSDEILAGRSLRSMQLKKKRVRPQSRDTVLYAYQGATELWRIFHDELDLDRNGHLDAEELAVALDKAGEWSALYTGWMILKVP